MKETEKLIINFTPTGMIPTKEQTKFVPIKPSEIIKDVLEAYNLGITSVHLHARNSDSQEPDYKAEIYAEIIAGIRKYAKDLVICVSLSGRNFNEFKKRSDPLTLTGNLKPDMGSLTLSSLNFNKQASINTPQMIYDLAVEMNKRKIKPELEAFDAGMINYAKYLINKNILKHPYYFNLILGNIACAQADILHAGVMINDLPDNSVWALGAIGINQLKINSLAISMGGGVRVGLEDNIWYDKSRTKLAKNIDLLKRIHSISKVNERTVMEPKEFRKLLNLKSGNGKYGCN
ncbi:MAG: 3-keto-5-aminohexanoate cleavage protein [Endomicrobiaceae bacterium]|nr:3-keto-5-aminohexanoate cleavage protein [Endomicrobiaceae bacterium]